MRAHPPKVVLPYHRIKVVRSTQKVECVISETHNKDTTKLCLNFSFVIFGDDDACMIRYVTCMQVVG